MNNWSFADTYDEMVFLPLNKLQMARHRGHMLMFGEWKENDIDYSGIWQKYYLSPNSQKYGTPYMGYSLKKD